MCDEHGLPETLSSDGGPEFTSSCFKQLLLDYGIFHRISSAYNPHSNCRAEIAVKLMKRLIRENVSSFGSLDNAKITRALLQHRNTPDRDTGLSPAQLLLGRNLKDFLPTPPGRQKLGLIWKKTLEAREVALQHRSKSAEAVWVEHTRGLPPLKIGDHVIVQNQHGNYPNKWDNRGVVVEVLQFHQYKIRLDGSWQSTLRNRKFLRKFTPLLQAPATTLT